MASPHSNNQKPDILVGQAPECDFSDLQQGIDALATLPEELSKTIFILDGEYHGQVISRLSNVTITGVGSVRLTAGHGALEVLPNGEERGTFRTATCFIEGENVRLTNLTIENTAGPGKQAGQAVALFNNASNATVTNCRLLGYQDTLCTGPLPPFQKDGTPFVSPIEKEISYSCQIYRNCYISGTIDFIFGGAEAWFDHCQIHSRASEQGYITAASTPEGQETGFEFHNCYLTADDGVTNVFLGRPWRPFAKTTFKHCRLGNHIAPCGWDNWDNTANETTTDYREIDSTPDTTTLRPDWITTVESND